MRVIIHIGQSKTGTTSLQSFLASNRESLAKSGILYPDVYRGGIPLKVQNHNSFAEALCGFRRFPGFSAEEYFSQFLEQGKEKGCNTLLLSGESFWGSPQIWRIPEGEQVLESHLKKIKKLKDFIGREECHLLLYLRRQDEWMDSNIPQLIRYEGLLKYPVYQNDAQTVDVLAPYLDYTAMLNLWEQVFENSQMTVIPYERDHLKNGDIVCDFMERIGADHQIVSLKSKETNEHTSLSLELVLLKKVLNRIPKSKAEERTIIDILTDLDEKMGSRRKYKIDTVLREELMNRVVGQNRLLTQKYSGNSPDFFSQCAAPRRRLSDSNSDGVSLEEGIAAMLAFDNAYYSISTWGKRFRFKTGSLLRRRFPILHALVRRILFFRR
jgi:hypothetical protein